MSKCVFPEIVKVIFTLFSCYVALFSSSLFFSFPVIWSKSASFSQRSPKWQCSPKLAIISSKLSVRLSSGGILENRGGVRCLVFGSSKHP